MSFRYNGSSEASPGGSLVLTGVVAGLAFVGLSTTWFIAVSQWEKRRYLRFIFVVGHWLTLLHGNCQEKERPG